MSPARISFHLRRWHKRIRARPASAGRASGIDSLGNARNATISVNAPLKHAARARSTCMNIASTRARPTTRHRFRVVAVVCLWRATGCAALPLCANQSVAEPCLTPPARLGLSVCAARGGDLTPTSVGGMRGATSSAHALAATATHGVAALAASASANAVGASGTEALLLRLLARLRLPPPPLLPLTLALPLRLLTTRASSMSLLLLPALRMLMPPLMLMMVLMLLRLLLSARACPSPSGATASAATADAADVVVGSDAGACWWLLPVTAGDTDPAPTPTMALTTCVCMLLRFLSLVVCCCVLLFVVVCCCLLLFVGVC